MSSSPASSSSKRATVFVQSLYELVSTCPQDVIGFAPGGTFFEIRNVNALCEDVLSQYFKHKNLSSFFRQLNLYGFAKLPLKNAGHAFRHDYFVQGRPDLLANVTRVKTNNRRASARSASKSASAASTTVVQREEAEDESDNDEEEEDEASPASSATAAASSAGDTASPPASSSSSSSTSSPLVAPAAAAAAAAVPSSKRVKRAPPSFLTAAYQIGMENTPAAGFNQTGTALEIRDELAFTTLTLPRFFKHSKMASFLRQLDRYGFERASTPPLLAFSHPHFRRGDVDALMRIEGRVKQQQQALPAAAASAAAPRHPAATAAASSPSSSPLVLPRYDLAAVGGGGSSPRLVPALPPALSDHQHSSSGGGKVRRKPLAFISGTFALCSLENEAVGFSPDGTCLEVRNESLFVNTHLEMCFKHRNITSFFRQLNMYGFYKRESGPGVSHTYVHENFRRGRMDLLVLIKRRHVKHALPVLEPDASFAAAELSSLRRHSVGGGNTPTTPTAPRLQPVVVSEEEGEEEEEEGDDNVLLSSLMALVERRDV